MFLGVLVLQALLVAVLVRTALLHDRTARSVMGRGWPLWASLTGVVTLLALVGAGLAGDPSGRSVTHTWPDGSSTAGPFPGWTFAGPQAVALALCLALAALVLRAASRRSAVVTADLDTDPALRRAATPCTTPSRRVPAHPRSGRHRPGVDHPAARVRRAGRPGPAAPAGPGAPG